MNLWVTLGPLVVGSAVVPIQIVLTILLLRSARATAFAFVLGMTVVRVSQGLVFGLILTGSSPSTAAPSSNDTSPFVSGVLLVLGVVFFVTAARQFFHGDDPDAPPPKWMTATATMTPVKAFLLGIALLAIGAKFWVFTLGAIASIGDADLGRTGAVVTFLAFVVLAELPHLAALGVATVAPDGSAALLGRASTWLERHNRTIVIALGVVFGTWFTVKALNGLGVI